MTTPNKSDQPLIIREAFKEDIPKLAQLHVVTWNATHPEEPKKPTFAGRESQWQQAFMTNDNSWFCYVIENNDGELIGFAKGLLEKDGSGCLNKLYLLDEYKKQGLGRKLLCNVTNKFYKMGVKVMWVVTGPKSSACTFYERFGGFRKPDTDPGIAVFVWKDLQNLITSCNNVL